MAGKQNSTVSLRPIAAGMLALGILTLGGLAAARIPVTVSRAAVYPGVTVEVVYSGVSPEKIEEIITRPLEDAVSTIGAIQSIRSESEEGKSRVHLRFEPDTNPEFKSLEIRERIDLVAARFPREAQKPSVLKYDPDQRPVMILLLKSHTRNTQELRDLADKELKQLFEGVPGVSQVFVAGGRLREVLVKCDRQRLESYGLTMRDVMSALQNANVNEGLGEIQDSSHRVRVTAKGRFESLREMAGTVLTRTENGVVYLEDVAQLEYAFQEQTTASRNNGEESITLYVYKAGNGDLLGISARIRELMHRHKRPDLEFEVLQDTAAVFRSALRWLGAILALSYLSVFLWGPRFFRLKLTVFIAAGATLLSSLGGILALYLAGIQLDLLALGALVCCAWLFLDRLHFLKQLPGRYPRACLQFCLMVLCFLLPVLVSGPEYRRIFGGMALFTSICLPSGFVLLFLARRALSTKVYRQFQSWIDYRSRRLRTRLRLPASLSQKKLKDRVRSFPSVAHVSIYRLVFQYPKGTYAISAILLLAAGAALPRLDVGLTPGLDAAEIQARVEMPSGTSFEQTDRAAQAAEKRLKELKEIEQITTRVDPAQAILTIKLKSGTGLSNSLMEKLKSRTRGLDPAFVHFSAESMGGSFEDLTVDVLGDDLDTLDSIVRELASRAKSIPGAGDVLLRYKPPRPEILLLIDKIKSEHSGISTQDVGENVRFAIQGGVATKYYTRDREIDVRIRYEEGNRATRADIDQIVVRRADGRFVPLKAIARQKESSMPVKIYRTNKKRAFGFSVQAASGTARTLAARMGFLTEIRLPEGYRIELGEALKAREDEQARISGLVAAVMLMLWMVLAGSSESLLTPMVQMGWLGIAVSVPLLVAWAVGLVFSVPVMMTWLMACFLVIQLVEPAKETGALERRATAHIAVAFFLPGLLLTSFAGLSSASQALGPMLILAWAAFVLPKLKAVEPGWWPVARSKEAQ